MATATKKAPAKKAAAKKAPAKKTATKKTAAKKAAPAKKENNMSKSLEVGSPVLVQVDRRQNSGSDVAAGLVTKAGEDVVNVRVFLDGDENLWLQGVTVVKSQPKDEDNEQADDETSSEAKVRRRVCWPA